MTKESGIKIMLMAIRCRYIGGGTIKATWGLPGWFWRFIFDLQCLLKPEYKSVMERCVNVVREYEIDGREQGMNILPKLHKKTPEEHLELAKKRLEFLKQTKAVLEYLLAECEEKITKVECRIIHGKGNGSIVE